MFDVICCYMVEDVLHGVGGSQLIEIIRAVLADELLEDRKQSRRASLHDDLQGLQRLESGTVQIAVLIDGLVYNAPH